MRLRLLESPCRPLDLWAPALQELIARAAAEIFREETKTSMVEPFPSRGCEDRLDVTTRPGARPIKDVRQPCRGNALPRTSMRRNLKQMLRQNTVT
mmetsp:Transcript_101069/g.179362  ORF Transcript_101069/g.179362 Transcript_101069/m.179362 type:complete len:96 (-) Transcript_101069:29-316(-)